MYKTLPGNKAIIKLSRSSIYSVTNQTPVDDLKNLLVIRCRIVDASDIGIKVEAKHEGTHADSTAGDLELFTLSLIIPWSSIEIINLVDELKDGWSTNVA